MYGLVRIGPRTALDLILPVLPHPARAPSRPTRAVHIHLKRRVDGDAARVAVHRLDHPAQRCGDNVLSGAADVSSRGVGVGGGAREGGGHLGVDVKVILTPPCIFCVGDH